MNDATEFFDDDASYLQWVREYPQGFVLNLRRTTDSNYVVLHLATCRSIAIDRPNGAYTARAYRKVVSTNLNELRKAAKREGRSDGSFSRHCALCRSKPILSDST